MATRQVLEIFKMAGYFPDRLVHAAFWLENLKRPSGRPSGIWNNNSKMYLRQDGQARTGLTCHRYGTSGWQLSIQQWSLGFHTYPSGTTTL
jgi:hypothetical protein